MASLLYFSTQIPYPPQADMPAVRQTHVRGLDFEKKPDSKNHLAVHANSPNLCKLPQV